MTEYQEIIIYWSTRYQINNVDDIKKIEIDSANVLYQLYGDHHVYGRHVIVYWNFGVCR
jgi:hypothetical protein